MLASLSRIRFAKADHPNSTFDGTETHNVQPRIQIPNGHKTRLRVINPVIRYDNGVAPLEINGALKWELPFGLVSGTLALVEFDSHWLIVVTIRSQVNPRIKMG
jgi:hypothetical protein